MTDIKLFEVENSVPKKDSGQWRMMAREREKQNQRASCGVEKVEAKNQQKIGLSQRKRIYWAAKNSERERKQRLEEE